MQLGRPKEQRQNRSIQNKTSMNKQENTNINLLTTRTQQTINNLLLRYKRHALFDRRS